MKTKNKTRRKTTGTRLLFLVVSCLCLTALASCNVTRTVTTKSEYMQRGDTAVTIVTKTIESYDATKKTNF